VYPGEQNVHTVRPPKTLTRDDGVSLANVSKTLKPSQQTTMTIDN